MLEQSRISRRHLIGMIVAAGASLFARFAGAAEAGKDCETPTPSEIEGPFFPRVKRADEDFDLTRIRGRAGRAAGEVIHVRGRVLDRQCRPVEGALIEVWQANKHGRYDHERDAGNPRPLDPNFQGVARIVTGRDGRFAIRTIKPGGYPANDQGWIRPPHIHFKVSRRGYRELTTQMYFEGEPLNDKDLLRNELSGEDQARVTVAFHPAPEFGREVRVGTFDITLGRVG